ncbi:SfnB family sulfur acquisition oxidoreductase [Rhodococcus aetherivorans]|uniref:SfnB family sulfur acquisition oxidoreductase n=1 Tax=Rhodococcus TaxID=1827 RepID=UPI000929E466|nr:SfnB family sulfur acquisition oxidoreductase [Rhodococcus sp. M8]OLL19708.1 SfnB family sulfur acquisition oxidoreductase [Rhodococcus sp. M8]QPG43547.1 SfnB family sulfur acquisition oxidoreductase [Rhodococcus sp. M8]
MGTAEVTSGIVDGDHALETATVLGRRFAENATLRDANRELPHTQIREFAGSGLGAVTVPRAYGGIDVPTETLVEIFRLLAEADPSIAQIPQSHFTFLELLRSQGTPDQQEFFYGEVRSGALFANAQSERGPHPVDVDTTVLVPSGAGFTLSGRKFYSTGALFADWIAVRASVVGDGGTPGRGTPKAVAFVPRDAAGLTVVDDWDGMGQRTTASGTVTLDGVTVPASSIVPYSGLFDGPTTYGAQAQILHAAIDVGIATGALREAVVQAGRARPHFEAGVDRAVDDPLLAQLAGEVTVTVRAAQALLTVAARAVDSARTDLDADTATAASIDVATAKVAATRAALDAANAVFELGGTRSASGAANLSRYWRDARTHTLHDATRWKLQHIGRWTLDGTSPPRHGVI